MSRLVWCRLPVLGKAVLLFVGIGFAVQILGVIFNKKSPALERAGPPLPVSGDAPTSCSPRTQVMFLKTHKTASSTLLNMLYRFGDARNLSFALPVGYQLGYPRPFHARYVKGYRNCSGQTFSIMCNHMRFYQPEVQKIMPRDTFYFSILRDPASLAESAYSYYKNSCPAFQGSRAIDDFIADPWRYYLPRLPNSHYARNLMWFDFGLEGHGGEFSLPLARTGVATVERSFHLLLLAEHFDESLVLLRHALCWTLDDVVSFPLNSRSGEAKARLSPDQLRRLREWNALDWFLYSSFNQTFWERVEAFGRDRMARELEELRERRRELQGLCLSQGGIPVEGRKIRDRELQPFQYGQAKIMGYMLHPGLDASTRETCLRMVIPELQYKDLLDAKQFPKRDTGGRGAGGEQQGLAHPGTGREVGTDTQETMGKGEADSERNATLTGLAR
ncbi:G3ST2 sulfotransferase, partial [Polyodon spathula]|nr:galactose-3-O-sulfotransferase 2-like [Polyodon spathula]MBN3275547.1 G3ST2 sulfotransferase [Polyodon spathula]